MKSEKTIAVAMSGGVDSSVAAAILKEKGYNIFGVTMLVCPPFKDILSTFVDARRICDHLGIGHHVFDIRKEFKKTIIDYFAREYFHGRTPNPCVKCNPEIKFGYLMDFALNLGTELFATGHYSRVVRNTKTGLFELRRGLDRDKDQSYVLYRLNQTQLSHTVFPLGDMTKEDVEEYSRKIDLPVTDKPESQEICFIPDNNYPGFLIQNYDTEIKPGPIIHKNGEILGEHRGLIYYTVGQRKRLGVSHHKPLYVIDIDAKNNTLIVGYFEDQFKREAIVENVNWISGYPPAKNRIYAKIRYMDTMSPALFEVLPDEDKIELSRIRITFDEPKRAITPGQSAVIYSYPDGDVALGGGIITRR